jgi:hypothetical protein
MPIRTENARNLSLTLLWQIQTARDEVPRQTFKEDAINGVIVALDTTVNDRILNRCSISSLRADQA